MEAETIRGRLINAKKIQLHSGMEGFESPDAYGIYRHTGGKPLGVVGKVYEPPDLNMFLDSIVKSVDSCADFLDINQLEYSEIKEGSKVRISLPGPKIEPKIKTVGTIIQTRLDFMTGFDGLTKTSLSIFTLNLWCSNGAAAWGKDTAFNLAFKNTPGNQGKWLMFCDEIVQALEGTNRYQEFLNKAATIQYTQADLDKFFTKLLGYSQKDHKELTARKRNILDKINATVAIESQANGTNLYSLLGGVTRYTTHDLCKGNMDELLTDNAAALNKDAQKMIAELVFN